MNTIGYVFALLANIPDHYQPTTTAANHHKPGAPFWRRMTRFLEVADPVQLRFIGKEWRYVVHYVEEVARKEGKVSRAMQQY